MIEMDEVLQTVGRVNRRELELWIERRWIRPHHERGTYLFADIDIARVALICDMRDDFMIDEETVPILLSLLDQIYALRRKLRYLTIAVSVLSPDARLAVAQELQRLETEEPKVT